MAPGELGPKSDNQSGIRHEAGVDFSTRVFTEVFACYGGYPCYEDYTTTLPACLSRLEDFSRTCSLLSVSNFLSRLAELLLQIGITYDRDSRLMRLNPSLSNASLTELKMFLELGSESLKVMCHKLETWTDDTSNQNYDLTMTNFARIAQLKTLIATHKFSRYHEMKEMNLEFYLEDFTARSFIARHNCMTNLDLIARAIIQDAATRKEICAEDLATLEVAANNVLEMKFYGPMR